MVPMDDLYAYYKSHGICVTCGQEDAKPGHVRCWRCLANLNENSNRLYHEMPDDKKAALLAERRRKAAIQRAERKANGQCPNCGRKLEDTNYSHCAKCRASAKRSMEKKRRKDGAMSTGLRGDGLWCAICLKRVETPGNKLCDRCYQNNLENMRKARAANSTANHPWRKATDLYFERRKQVENDRERV